LCQSNSVAKAPAGVKYVEIANMHHEAGRLSKVGLKNGSPAWIIQCMHIRMINASERPLLFDETFMLTVLGETQQHLIACKAANVVGRRLIAQVSEHLCQDTSIRIDRADSLFLGEVLGCWYEGPAIFAAIELKHALSGLDELARVRSGFLESTADPLEPAMRQCA
jgi:hypothetical protein